jgi:hypothetical protein
VYLLSGDKWKLNDAIPGVGSEITMPNEDLKNVQGIAITAVSRTGVESEPWILAL